MNYVIVVDSNILFMNYKNNNFNEFDFNCILKNTIDIIKSLNLENHIRIVLPEVVWLELKQQRKEKYHDIYNKLKDISQRYILPNVSIELTDINNDDRLDKIADRVMQRYVDEKKFSYDMPIVINKDSIVMRAIRKRPPFEGIDGKSDKGFKDALLWESIINFKQTHTDEKIILYCNDKMFNNDLKEEYRVLFNESLQIVSNEGQLRDYISNLVEKPDNVSFNDETSKYNTIYTALMKDDFIKNEYIRWMNVLKAYPDVEVVSAGNLDIINITETNESIIVTDAKFYAYAKIISTVQIYESGEKISFNPILHIGVNLIENRVESKLEGIEGTIHYVSSTI